MTHSDVQRSTTHTQICNNQVNDPLELFLLDEETDEQQNGAEQGGAVYAPYKAIATPQGAEERGLINSITPPNENHYLQAGSPQPEGGLSALKKNLSARTNELSEDDSGSDTDHNSTPTTHPLPTQQEATKELKPLEFTQSEAKEPAPLSGLSQLLKQTPPTETGTLTSSTPADNSDTLPTTPHGSQPLLQHSDQSQNEATEELEPLEFTRSIPEKKPAPRASGLSQLLNPPTETGSTPSDNSYTLTMTSHPPINREDDYSLHQHQLAGEVGCWGNDGATFECNIS